MWRAEQYEGDSLIQCRGCMHDAGGRVRLCDAAYRIALALAAPPTPLSPVQEVASGQISRLLVY